MNNSVWAYQNGTPISAAWGTTAEPIYRSTGPAASWSQARSTANWMGGDLAVIRSADQNKAALGSMAATGQAVWLGADVDLPPVLSGPGERADDVRAEPVPQESGLRRWWRSLWEG